MAAGLVPRPGPGRAPPQPPVRARPEEDGLRPRHVPRHHPGARHLDHGGPEPLPGPRRNPVGIIGFAAATEGLGAALAPKVAAAMRQYEFAKDALSFLKVHSTEDQEHIETVRKGFLRCAEDSEAYTVMVAAWKYTLRAYAQLFTDALERGSSDLAAAAPRIG
ncbi:iron-containing redox enzyme family protein [Streptomyces nogalater]